MPSFSNVATGVLAMVIALPILFFTVIFDVYTVF